MIKDILSVESLNLKLEDTGFFVGIVLQSVEQHNDRVCKLALYEGSDTKCCVRTSRVSEVLFFLEKQMGYRWMVKHDLML